MFYYNSQCKEIEKEVEQLEKEEEKVEKDKNDEGESKSEICEQQAAMSSDSLLCDEQISNITPDVSPANNDKSKEDSVVTPKQESMEISSLIDLKDVKRTLNLDGVRNDEKITLKIDIDENDSIISDKTGNDNDDDSLLSKSELSLVGSVSSKRNRKTKPATVVTNLPYKAPTTPAGRRKRPEKKLELEHDFHDPLNKILWEEGIGGLNNCNKLFGFDDFGLVEVITKKDAKAKMDRNEEKKDEIISNFKLKKILNPEDQYVCVVCSKLGTIRDFFSPECCSEACLAITKRKAFEYGSRDDQQHDSGQSSPNTDARKINYGGEFVSLQQLQTFLMKQKLPGKYY